MRFTPEIKMPSLMAPCFSPIYASESGDVGRLPLQTLAFMFIMSPSAFPAPTHAAEMLAGAIELPSREEALRADDDAFGAKDGARRLRH